MDYRNYDGNSGRNYEKNYTGNVGRNYGSYTDGQEGYDDKTINAENLNIDTTLSEISCELRPGETLVLDIGNNYFNQTDEIYDTLVMRGYEVKKSFRNGRNQIIVSKKA